MKRNIPEMPLNLAKYEQRARAAVKQFWTGREEARLRQVEKGIIDVGGRAEVTGGKNMNGFVSLVKSLVVANGLPADSVFSGLELRGSVNRCLTLPGFYRPLKDWDLLVIHKEMLVAAIEFKSQIGPSFGNNFNNRCEEALGTATDLLVAFREGAFGNSPRPFVGFLMLLEDCPRSRMIVKRKPTRFTMFPEFNSTSYADCYEIFCRKIVQEQLFESAALLLSSREGGIRGKYSQMSDKTNLHQFVVGLAGHVAQAAMM
jgi:Restriction endonuclease XhoI